MPGGSQINTLTQCSKLKGLLYHRGIKVLIWVFASHMPLVLQYKIQHSVKQLSEPNKRFLKIIKALTELMRWALSFRMQGITENLCYIDVGCVCALEDGASPAGGLNTECPNW